MKTHKDPLVRQDLSLSTPGEEFPQFLLEAGARIVISVSPSWVAGAVILDVIEPGSAAREIWRSNAAGNSVLEGLTAINPLHYRIRASADFDGSAEVSIVECPDDVNVVFGSAAEQDIDTSKEITWLFLGPLGAAAQPIFVPSDSPYEYYEHLIVVKGIATAGAFDESFTLAGRAPLPPWVGTPIKFAVVPVNLGIGGTTKYSTLTLAFGSALILRHDYGRSHWQLVITTGDVLFNV